MYIDDTPPTDWESIKNNPKIQLQYKRAIKNAKRKMMLMKEAHEKAATSTLSFHNTNTFPPRTGVTIDWEKVKSEMEALYKCADCGCDNTNRYYNEHKSLCYSCEQKREALKKVEWLCNRESNMTLESRVEELESWMYNMIHNPPRDPFNTLLR